MFKPKKLITALGLVACLFAGCAGRNHTLFMTKSNVGLDFDSKPPTLEVSIARKEAVIAPTFEGGVSPPVLASFKPAVEGAFTSFFLGVDQTFAGGDAALAMAMLYNEPTQSDITKYDSSIPLSTAVTYDDWFRGIPGAGETRPLIFGTDTSFGLKAAWSGTGGQIPDTVRLGFNRKEFAWAPLLTSGTGASTKVSMPAFLATIESAGRVGTNGGRIEALQYFATGKAATYLAMRKEVRAAMHARLDPNADAQRARFSEEGTRILGNILFSLTAVLRELESSGDSVASGHLKKFNALPGINLPWAYHNELVPVYEWDSKTLILHRNPEAEITLDGSLDGIIALLSSMKTSKERILAALAEIANKKDVSLQKGKAKPAVIDAKLHNEVLLEFTALKELDQRIRSTLIVHKDINAAFEYVQSRINNQK